VWDLDAGVLLATFTGDADACCCAFVSGEAVLLGDEAGRMHYLALELQTRN
jgi:hypothetical protein